MLSALTNIPQTLLFGRSPAGMNATGDSDLENYYNFVERIQKLMLKKNLRYLMDILFRAGVASGELDEEPDYKLQFNPLWSLSDSEQAAIDQQKAATAMTKAQTAQIYVDMQALDPTEVRRKLASDDEFNVEDIIDEEDDDIYSALFGNETGEVESDTEAAIRNIEQSEAAGGVEQSATAVAEPEMLPEENTDSEEPNTVGVLVIKNGKVLTGVRKSDFHPFTICGAGGHIEEGETPEQAAIRETQEEFGITPTELYPLTVRTGLAEEYGVPAYFLCTEYDGEPRCDDHSEMVAPQMSDLGQLLKAVKENSESLFAPFADSVRVLNDILYQEVNSDEEIAKVSEKDLPKRKKSAIIIEEDEFNESDHPRDENGKFSDGGGGSSSSEQPAQGNVSPDGVNEPCKGFSAPEKLADHSKRHGKLEMGITSEEEYLKKATSFLCQPCGGDIDGYSTSDGRVVRFNRKTTEYAAGTPNGDINTYMLAKFNKATGTIDVERANDYFDRCKKKGR